jgi:hypothetical protein
MILPSVVKVQMQAQTFCPQSRGEPNCLSMCPHIQYRVSAVFSVPRAGVRVLLLRARVRRSRKQADLLEMGENYG